MNQESTTFPINPLTPRRRFVKRLIATAAGITLFSDVIKGTDNKTKNKTNNYSPSPTSTTPYLGEIALFAFNFAPTGWAQCNGQLLLITQNQALFSLLGTQFGGNGTTNFALPDLRGRVVISSGQGPGLSNRIIGENGGEESITLIGTELPAHSHALAASSSSGNSASPSGNFPAANSEGVLQYTSVAPDSTMNSGVVGLTGSNQAHNNMQPFLVLNYCIAVTGTFPTHS